MKNKLRLLFTEDCNRSCEGCCNKQFDLSALPVCTDYSPYDEILVTGGEPMLHYFELMNFLALTKQYNDAKVILYTAMADGLRTLAILNVIDGITLTLHELSDIPKFKELCRSLETMAPRLKEKSLRLNVFDGIEVDVPKYWSVKKNMRWIEDCPLPENEVFMRRK